MHIRRTCNIPRRSRLYASMIPFDATEIKLVPSEKMLSSVALPEEQMATICKIDCGTLSTRLSTMNPPELLNFSQMYVSAGPDPLIRDDTAESSSN